MNNDRARSNAQEPQPANLNVDQKQLQPDQGLSRDRIKAVLTAGFTKMGNAAYDAGVKVADVADKSARNVGYGTNKVLNSAKDQAVSVAETVADAADKSVDSTGKGTYKVLNTAKAVAQYHLTKARYTAVGSFVEKKLHDLEVIDSERYRNTGLVR